MPLHSTLMRRMELSRSSRSSRAWPRNVPPERVEMRSIATSGVGREPDVAEDVRAGDGTRAAVARVLTLETRGAGVELTHDPGGEVVPAVLARAVAALDDEQRRRMLHDDPADVRRGGEHAV